MRGISSAYSKKTGGASVLSQSCSFGTGYWVDLPSGIKLLFVVDADDVGVCAGVGVPARYPPRSGTHIESYIFVGTTLLSKRSFSTSEI